MKASDLQQGAGQFHEDEHQETLRAYMGTSEGIGPSFRKRKAAEFMSWSMHQLLLESQHYEETVKAGSDMWLPSSPQNGLYRMIESSRRHRWLLRDLDEYRINEHRERHGLPLVCWRKQLCRI